MTLDPTTLTAVRERIEALRIGGDIAKRGLSWIDARNSTVDEAIGRINVMIDSPDVAPPLTADDVRRIVDERVANALRLADDPDAILKLVDDALGKPPAPTPPPKRVEAWRGETVYGPVVSMYRPKEEPSIYLTHFHGVTDAASAEAFERAVEWAERTLRRIDEQEADPDDVRRVIAALAPFLPEPPR